MAGLRFHSDDGTDLEGVSRLNPLPVAIVSGGGEGGGSGLQGLAGEVPGPASYPTDGFIVDLSAVLTRIDWFGLTQVDLDADLPPFDYQVVLDAPALGQVKVKLNRLRYDRPSAVGNVSGQNGAVTVLASGGFAATVDAVGGSQGAGRVNQLYQHQHSISVVATNLTRVEVPAGTDLSAARWRYLAIGVG